VLTIGKAGAAPIKQAAVSPGDDVSKAKIFPVIMSGGSGTRLWPLSTQARPKQFHVLGADISMIGDTARRLSGSHGDFEFLSPIVICGAGHRELVTELLSEAGIEPAAVLLEPEGRNTAATAALAAIIAERMDSAALVLLAPADHLVARPEALMKAVSAAIPAAHDHIVTFGIHPAGPEIGYGYIKQGAAMAEGVFKVAEFKEKPLLPIAQQYLAEGGYSWNSGMFFFSPKVMLEEFAIASSDIREGARKALDRGRGDGAILLLDADSFAKVRAEPVDIAVMEHTKRAAVALCDIGWADVGSWAELWRLSEKDGQGNAIVGSATILDASNNLVRGEGIHVSAIGVSDLVIVATPHAVLIMPKSRAQDVKKVIPPKG
jgi:mannose-1-phosphate guanylyltransferase/mannose-6-phosphate isomerase